MASLTQVDVPDIGDFTDIPITEVFVAVGDTVELESPLVEIESDKATMEVPSPAAGVIREVLVAVGDKVSQGTPLVQLEASGNGAAPAPSSEAAAPSSEAAAPAAVASAISAEAQADGPSLSADSRQTPPTPGGPVHASPLARRLASDLGVDLSGITGTGRNGRITKDDVLSASAGRSLSAVSPQMPPKPSLPVP